jgi:hypothetical protein
MPAACEAASASATRAPSVTGSQVPGARLLVRDQVAQPGVPEPGVAHLLGGDAGDAVVEPGVARAERAREHPLEDQDRARLVVHLQEGHPG